MTALLLAGAASRTRGTQGASPSRSWPSLLLLLDPGGRHRDRARAARRSPGRSRRAGCRASTSPSGVPGRRPHDGRRADAADERRRRWRRCSSTSRCSRSATSIRASTSRSSATSPTPTRASCPATRRSSRAARAGIERAQSALRPGARAIASSCFIASGAGTRASSAWMGWERKRGKIEEFNRLLRGATDTSFTVQVGDAGDPAVGALLHHARHRHAAAARRREGADRHHRASAEPAALRPARSAASPRATASCSRASASRWRAPPGRCSRASTPATPASIRTRPRSPTSTRICSTKASSRARASTTSTRSRRALDGRVPENALLSHDLFEGLYARTALVTDVEVVDDYPSSVLAHARRQHRWVRGDWQILWWLLPVRAVARRACSAIACRSSSRWKILDNLRRSLMAPATRGAAAPGLDRPAGQSAGVDGDRSRRGRAARVAAAAAAARRAGAAGIRAGVPARPPSRISTTDVVARRAAAGVPREPGLRDGARDHRDARASRRSPSSACSSGRPRRPAPHRGGPPRLRVFVTEMMASPLIAAGSLALVVADPSARAAGVAAGAARCGRRRRSIAYALSRPVPTRRARARRGGPRVPRVGGAQDVALLRDVRRRRRITRLPPDNVQLVPELTVAHRTSPTNIGMALLATLAAHDFGFIDTDELVDRIDATLTTVESLERFEGHLLNWYDTRTLAPLPPAYVSTVDSGNLAGALLTLAVALHAAGRGCPTRRPAPDRLAARAVALFDGDELPVPLRPAAAAVHHRLSPRGRTTARAAAIRRTTTCWPPRRGSPAFSRSPRATSPSRTGSISDGRSPASAARRCCCRGAPRCSST